MPEFPETIDDVILECILKTRYQDEDELWDRFRKRCDRLKIYPMWGQLREGLGRLKKAGKLTYAKGKGVKR